jgi:nitroreductase
MAGNLRTPTRNYSELLQAPFPLFRLIMQRRSVRKYRDEGMPISFTEGLQEVASAACEARHVPKTDILLVTEKVRIREIASAAYRGFAGKINPWLPKAPALGFLVPTAAESGRGSPDRPVDLARACMALEDIVLWLVQNGMGSCWLGGINEAAVRRVLSVRSSDLTPAVVVFGAGPETLQPFTMDSVIYRFLSSKRKTLQEISFRSRVGTPWTLCDDREFRLVEPADMLLPGLLREMMQRQERTGRKPETPEWELILESARLAPSATNAQQWLFIVVEEKEALQTIRESVGSKREISGALVFLGKKGNRTTQGRQKPYWMIDVPIAQSHASLTAAALGLNPRIHMEMETRSVRSLVRAVPGWDPVGVMTL